MNKKHFSIYVTEEQISWLRRESESMGLTISAYIRWLVIREKTKNVENFIKEQGK